MVKKLWRWKLSIRSLVLGGDAETRTSPALRLGGPLGLWAPGIPESREDADTVRGARMIVTGGGTMPVIVVMTIHSIESENEGKMIAGDARGLSFPLCFNLG